MALSRKILSFSVALFIFSFIAHQAHAMDLSVFGPKKYLRTIGNPNIYHDTFSGSRSGGKIVIKNGEDDGKHRVTSALVHLNGEQVLGPNDFKQHIYFLEIPVSVQEDNSIRLELKSKPGAYLTFEILQQVQDPPSVNLEASPENIQIGGSSTLLWNSANGHTCVVEPDIGTVDENGSMEVFPTVTTTYTITATGMGGTASASATVTVSSPPPIVEFNAIPDEIQQGESATLTWSTTYADSCTIEPEIGTVEVNGSITVSPSETTSYVIMTIGPGGATQGVATIVVSGMPGPPVVEFAITPSVVSKGQPAILTWNSRHAQSAHIDNGIGPVPVAGLATVSPSHTTTYTITVTGLSGSSSAQAQVMVTGNPEPPAVGSFAETYQNLIPADATIESYDSRRFSVITGLVYGVDESPMADVSVTIHGHPEYGTAFTGADGRFSIPMEGGATFTIAYNKDGWLTSHRQAYVPWNDIAIAEKVVMIARDTASTTIAFDGDPATVVTHQSSMLTDEFGSRSCSMVFTGDNRAYLTDENGNDVYELTTITARATAYATPESMPAVLPPNSGFTYCVELAVDGAQRVRFARPVVVWVDNYLGFDVGEIVPVGYYDRDRGVWVPSDNGKVVRLLDTDSDGIVDSLDATGNGQPDDLNGDGFFTDEVYGISDPARFIPGATFWRVAVTHFTPWDCNWPFGPPQNAISPNPQGVPDADQPTPEAQAPPEDTKCLNSYVKQRSRVYHEDIPIAGTDITLHYASSRTSGYKTVISVPASGESVPASLKEIIVKVMVAGNLLEQKLAPLPNQKAEFAWDGLDCLGNEVQGSASANISVGFVYEGVYYGAGQDFVQAFAQAGSDVTAIRAQQEVISWKNSRINLSREKSTIAEGWTLSPHYQIGSGYAPELHKGVGGILANNTLIIDTVAGTGEQGGNGDGGPAVEARLGGPCGIAIDGEGNLYIADSRNSRIRKVDTTGNITTVAGIGGWGGFSGDGGPAVLAELNYPTDVAVDAGGNLYIADYSNVRVRKVDIDGMISTVAGNGLWDGGGDGCPAIQASINPTGLTVDNWGNLYFSEEYFHRVRKVDTDGIITTVAGTGIEGFDGHGGPGNQAKLSWPSGVAVDSSGNLYIGETGNYCVRKVDTTGIITAAAGDGSRGFSGDGGPAVLSQIGGPSGLAIDPAGNLYISDPWNRRIRRVDTSGFIVSVAGNGTYGSTGDGGPATLAGLRYPYGVALDASGNLYIADRTSNRVRKADLSNFSVLLFDSELLFTEEGDTGHIMSSSGLHRKTIDLKTGVVLRGFDYDENNNLVSINDRFGNRTLVERDSTETVIAIISPDGLRTGLQVGSDRLLNTIIYPDGSSFRFEYLPNGLMAAKIDPNGNRFENVFDSKGRLSTISDEEGGLWQYSRTAETDGDILIENLTAEGNLTTLRDHTDSTGAYTSIVTDSTGAETIHSRSADGLTVQESLSCGMNLSFQYDIDSLYKFQYVKQMAEKTPSGLQRNTLREKTYEDTDADDIPDLITESVTVNGKTSVFDRDVLQSQKVFTSPEERTVTTFYDPVTLVTQRMSIPGLFDTTYDYDIKGRLSSIATNTRQASFTYNSQGFLDSVTDPEGYTTFFAYDAIGRPLTVYRPDGSTIGFSYDQSGNQTAVVTPGSVDHSFGYNRVNRNTSYVAPISGRYEYLYDRERRLIQTKFPSGFQINNIYDKTRLVQVQTPEGNIDFSYLCGTKLGSATNGTNSINFGYDGKLITSEILSGMLNQILSYTYNNDFNIESFTYAGQTTNYTYDNDRLLIGSGPFTLTRNAGNRLPETVSDGIFSQSRTFNGYGEAEAQGTSIGGHNVFSWTLGLDKTGRITSKSETINGRTENYAYTYDHAGRLKTVAKDGDPVEEYTYDINGTRIFERNALRGIAGRSFTYSDEDHLLSAADTTYQYDVDGFLKSKTKRTEGTTAYNYSNRGELLSVSLPDGRNIEYIHDPLGRRIAKKVNGVTVEKYLWSGLTKLLSVYDGASALKMRFEYADDRTPVAVTIAGAMHYLAYDQVGSLRQVADGSGNVVKMVQYDSFGNVIFDSNPAFEIPFGFAGGLYDKDTNLVHFGYRDYDPDTGRWTAKDTLLFAGGDTDLYGYILNNPMNMIDPLGLWQTSVHAELATSAMIALGFSQHDIDIAVNANINVDRVANQFNDAAHYMPGTNSQAQALIIESLIEAAGLAQNKKHDQAIAKLGEALHTAQDYWAHAKEDAGWIAHLPFLGTDPDNPNRHLINYGGAFGDSLELLKRFQNARGACK
jgi:RHS repeat-associated protein